MNTYSELFKGLGFDGHLKISFLAGMIGLKGSCAHLKDLKAGSRSVKATLKLEVETRYESLNMNSRGLERSLSSDLRDDSQQATHFVGGVQWGAHAYASVESERSMGADAKSIEAKLSAQLSELGASLLQLCGGGVGLGACKAMLGGQKGRMAIEEEEKFKFRVDADVLPDSTENVMLPKNFEEAWTLLSRIPAQLVHNTSQGQGIPLRFTLYPLSQLEKKLPPHFQLPLSMAPRCTNFTSPAVEALERLLNDLQSVKQDLHDLYEDLSIRHSAAFSRHDMEKVAGFTDNLEAAEGQLRAAVREQVIAIRSQKGEAAGLEKIIRDFLTQSQSAPSNARAFMGSYMRKLRMLINLKEHGVQFVVRTSSSPSRSTSSLASSEECFTLSEGNGASKWVVVLTYCEPSGRNNRHEWNDNWNTFWHLYMQSRCGQELEMRIWLAGIRFIVQEIQDSECSCKTRVSVYRDGDAVSEDTASLMLGDPHSGKLQKNLVHSRVTHEVIMQAPNARVPLQTYCPGHHVQSSFMGTCVKHVINDWACERCQECVEYGKDGFLYCGCGRAPLRRCRFRCSSQKHGPLFVAFPENEDVERILERQEAPQQLNILLLGETGVGKSTFINAFANYLTFGSLESAIDSAEDLVGLIPMAFTHTDQMTFETIDIKFGQPDANELHHEGQSATQTCRSYTIPLNQHQIVHLIDTPGVGDTRGIEYDQVNFQNILSYLTHYTEIHGICVMLKPNTARLTVTFRFCIKELLRHLHKSASENIVFLFTNARSTFYTPGDTVVPLNTLLREIQKSPPHVQIAFNQRTVYCMDNEAFRYLLASKEGCFFPPEDKASYSQSWDKSAQQCQRMLEHFRSLEAHNVRETVSLNNAWSLVSKLQKPLEDVTNTIQLNLTNWGVTKKELEEFQGNRRELESIFKGDEVLNLQAVPFKKGARTVCTSTGSCCESRESVNGEIEVFYKHVCHEPCSSSKVVRMLTQGKALWFCKVMDRQGMCKVCKCHYKKHVRITYNAKLVSQKVFSEGIEKILCSNSKMINAKELKILELGNRCEEWQQELDAITQACARFALFFKNNAITPFNNDMKAYVHHQIAEESSRSKDNRALIARWEAFLEAYQKQINDLERMIDNNSAHPAHTEDSGTSRRSSQKNSSMYGTGAEILELATNLFQLKHTGATIKTLVDEVSDCEYRTQFHHKTFSRVRKNVAKLKAHVVACSSEGALQDMVPSRLAIDERPSVAAHLKRTTEAAWEPPRVDELKSSPSVLTAYQGEASSSKSETSSQGGSKASIFREAFSCYGGNPSVINASPRSNHSTPPPRFVSEVTPVHSPAKSLSSYHASSETKGGRAKSSSYHASSKTMGGRARFLFHRKNVRTVASDQSDPKEEGIRPAFPSWIENGVESETHLSAEKNVPTAIPESDSEEDMWPTYASLKEDGVGNKLSSSAGMVVSKWDESDSEEDTRDESDSEKDIEPSFALWKDNEDRTEGKNVRTDILYGLDR